LKLLGNVQDKSFILPGKEFPQTLLFPFLYPMVIISVSEQQGVTEVQLLGTIDMFAMFKE
jgi:hypothetical protein